MSTKNYFNFVIFYRLFCEKYVKKCNTTNPIMMGYLLGEKLSNVSEIKNGNRGIPIATISKINHTSVEELSSRINGILTGKHFGDELEIRVQQEIILECKNTIHSLCKLHEDGILNFHDATLVKYLDADDIDMSLKLAYLFAESLKTEFHIESQDYYDELINIINGKYFTNSGRRLPERYYGTYTIYYYSNHYENEIHCGLLRIFADSKGNDAARMIYGLNSIEKLKDPLIRNALNAQTSTEANTHFEEFLNKYMYRYDKRCHLMNGEVISSDYRYYMEIKLKGNGSRSEIMQTLCLNLTRAADNINKAFNYRGGLGLMMVTPHRSTPKVRVYKVGVADENIPINLNDKTLKKLLKLKPNVFQRVQVQKDDDSSWWDYILKCEACLQEQWICERISVN